MDAVSEQNFDKLKLCLQELLLLYRELFEVVRHETELLITVDIENLQESNRVKEALLLKIKNKDLEREKIAMAHARNLGIDQRDARLLEIAKKVSADNAKILRDFHATLALTIENVTSLNRENEIYTRSALTGLAKAMSNIKDTLGGKKTYEKKGKISEGQGSGGHFVSREA